MCAAIAAILLNTKTGAGIAQLYLSARHCMKLGQHTYDDEVIVN